MPAKLKTRKAGVLPIRFRGGRVEVCLVSSRRNRGRIVLPKGTLKGRESPSAAAMRDLFEEAGLKGALHDKPHIKVDKKYRRVSGRRAFIVYFPMIVEVEAKRWPERGLRARRWVSLPDIERKKKYRYVGRIVKMFRTQKPERWKKLLRAARKAKSRLQSA